MVTLAGREAKPWLHWLEGRQNHGNIGWKGGKAMVTLAGREAKPWLH